MGQFQRLSIVRQLPSKDINPEIIFLDEPSANLDRANTLILIKFITREICPTIFVSTHDQNLISILDKKYEL